MELVHDFVRLHCSPGFSLGQKHDTMSPVGAFPEKFSSFLRKFLFFENKSSTQFEIEMCQLQSIFRFRGVVLGYKKLQFEINSQIIAKQ